MTLSQIPNLIWVISIATTLLPIGVLFFQWQNFRRKSLRLLLSALILSAISDITGILFVEYKIPTHIVYNLQDLLQFVLVSGTYYQMFLQQPGQSRRWARIVILAGTCVYLGALLITTVLFQNPLVEHQNLMWVVSAVVISIYGCAYFNDLIGLVSFQKGLRLDLFVWINSGLLYYFSFTIFLFLCQNILVSKLDADIYRLIWSYNNVNNIIKNTLITIGLIYYSSED
jgi:hypothetical protein